MPIPSRLNTSRTWRIFRKFKMMLEPIALHISNCYECEFKIDLVLQNRIEAPASVVGEVMSHAHTAGFRTIGKRKIEQIQDPDWLKQAADTAATITVEKARQALQQPAKGIDNEPPKEQDRFNISMEASGESIETILNRATRPRSPRPPSGEKPE